MILDPDDASRQSDALYGDTDRNETANEYILVSGSDYMLEGSALGMVDRSSKAVHQGRMARNGPKSVLRKRILSIHQLLCGLNLGHARVRLRTDSPLGFTECPSLDIFSGKELV